MTSIVKLTVHTELFLLFLNNIFETCSCRPVRRLFWDDITKFWDENFRPIRSLFT